MKSNKNIYAEWLNALCAAPNCCTTTKIGSSPIHEKFSCRGTGISQWRWSVLRTIMLLCAPFTSPESGWGRRPCICAPDLAEPSDPRSSRRTPAPRCCSDAKSEERERFSLNAVWFIHSPSQRWARSQLTVPWTGSEMLTCPLRNWNLNTTGKKMSPWLLS